MPKSKRNPQPSLFRRKVPKMPDGYYAPGPNPNLARFVAEHATPYDAATDAYDVPPFDQPITTTKATAIYNMHTYWSKKPHDAIRQYIRHYTQPGDLVLDPFCGSGGTALAALMEGRAAIAIDLSPAATFITKNYCTPVDVDELQRAFEELQQKVKPEMDWLYATRCDRCDGRATTAYTVYSQVFQCPRCLEKTPLFDCIEVEGQTQAGKPKTINVCPHCYKQGHNEEIRSQSQKFGAIPVLVCYECQEGCKPKRGKRRHDDPDPKRRRFFEVYDLTKIQEIEEKSIPHWYPPTEFPRNFARWKSDLRLLGITKVAELFTKRNLWALAALLDATKKTGNDSLLFAFQSNVLSGTIMQQWREAGGGFAKGTYYVPQVFIEREQLACLGRKVADVVQGKAEISGALAEPQIVISTQTAIDLAALPSNSLDYVFTDPPYADKVQYGELNFIWEAWLGFDTDWHDQEVIVNETRGMTDADWARLMRQAMGECYRVLKPGRWLSLCYHDTSEGTWQLVQDIMAEVGFITESGGGDALYIDAGQKSYNQLTADKVTKRDLVINFRKPRPGEVAPALAITGDEDAATFAEKARAILADALERHPGASADRLYDELVSRMVRRGAFERHNFEDLLSQVAEPVREPVMRTLFDPTPPNLFGTHETVRWYLLDTAGQVDEAESNREAAAAARLEAFVHGRLAAQPWERGVHYSDLFEQYLPLRDKPRRLLADWLPEFFCKTEEGAWRPPADAAERSQLAALRSSGSLRRIKRFANALLEGTPPADRDRPVSAADAADWIRQCRRAGLFSLGRAIYEKGGLNFATLSDAGQVEVEEDYEVCVRRSE